MKKLLLIYFVLLFASCSPSEEAIQRAIEQTEAARPAPTETPKPTRVPLSEIDLQPILIQEGDLPPGYKASQFRVEDNKDISPYVYQSVKQMLEFDGDTGGFVEVMICKDLDWCSDHYDKAADYYNEIVETPEGMAYRIVNTTIIGGKSIAVSLFAPLKFDLDPIEASYVHFIRCNTYVKINMNRADDINGAIEYGKRLDDRLSKIVCE